MLSLRVFIALFVAALNSGCSINRYSTPCAWCDVETKKILRADIDECNHLSEEKYPETKRTIGTGKYDYDPIKVTCKESRGKYECISSGGRRYEITKTIDVTEWSKQEEFYHACMKRRMEHYPRPKASGGTEDSAVKNSLLDKNMEINRYGSPWDHCDKSADCMPGLTCFENKCVKVGAPFRGDFKPLPTPKMPPAVVDDKNSW